MKMKILLSASRYKFRLLFFIYRRSTCDGDSFNGTWSPGWFCCIPDPTSSECKTKHSNGHSQVSPKIFTTKNIFKQWFSGPACGVVAGSKIPNYCVMSDTSNVARVIEKMGEGMRIHISGTSKALLDTVGGFRCEYRGLLDLGVSFIEVKRKFLYKIFLETLYPIKIDDAFRYAEVCQTVL